MKLNSLHALLTIGASATFATAAFATTWDATADFNAASNSGVWTYGTCAVSNNAAWTLTTLDVNNYVFSADTYSAATFGGGSWVGEGSVWAKSKDGNTEWGNNGEPLAWVGVLSNHSQNNPWIFTTLGLYVQPYSLGVTGPSYGVTGDATVIRWTAPESGTFDLTGSVTGLNAAGLVDQIIKTDANGVRTVVHSTAPLAADATDTLTGSVDLLAGETLDLVAYQSPVYLRAYGKVDFQVSNVSVPEPTSLGLLGLGGIALLRRRHKA